MFHSALPHSFDIFPGTARRVFSCTYLNIKFPPSRSCYCLVQPFDCSLLFPDPDGFLPCFPSCRNARQKPLAWYSSTLSILSLPGHYTFYLSLTTTAALIYLILTYPPGCQPTPPSPTVEPAYRHRALYPLVCLLPPLIPLLDLSFFILPAQHQQAYC